MKFEKNNKYFTICIYAVVSTLVTVGIGIALFNIESIWGGLVKLLISILELLKPLLIGLVLAYLLEPIVTFYTKKCEYNPICKWYKKKDISRSLGTVLAVITIVTIVGLFVLVVTLNINKVLETKSVEGFVDRINAYSEYFQGMINNVMTMIESLNLSIQSTQILNKVYQIVDQLTANLTEKVIEIIKGLGSNAISIGLGIIISLYLVQDKINLLKGWNKFLDLTLPDRVKKIVREIGQDMDYVFSGYIRGQLIDAVIMAGLISVALTIIRLDFAIIIGIIAGIFNIIPYFGPVVGFVLAGIIGSIGAQPQKGIYAMVSVLALQQIDGWFIVPKVIGESVKLHPVVVLLAIVIGGELFGLAGILLGVPVAAFIRITFMRYIGDRLE